MPASPPRSVDELLPELEARLDFHLERVALRRDVRDGWEAWTGSGDVGRGDTMAEAIADLFHWLPPA